MQLRKLAPVPSTVSILTYHHVAAHDTAYPYDRGVADATPAQFRRQMEMLARYGTPIGIDELVRALDGAPLPKNPVMVTFDDGYRSCHDVALPILRAVGMRATFFVATGYINDRRLYWWERIALALSQLAQGDRDAHLSAADRDRGPQPALAPRLTDLIKNTPRLDVQRFLDELVRGVRRRVEPRDRGDARRQPDHVVGPGSRALACRHGRRVAHALAPRAEDARRRGARATSSPARKAELETQLGRPVRAIAYPVGRRIAHCRAHPRCGRRRRLQDRRHERERRDADLAGAARRHDPDGPVRCQPALDGPLDVRRHVSSRRSPCRGSLI